MGVTVSALRRLVLKELTDKARGVPLQRAGDGLRAVQNAWRAPAPGPRTSEGRQPIARARTVHGGYSAENRQVAAMIRDLKAEAKRLVELS